MADYILAATVHVEGETWEAGAKVPVEVARLITNPKAWVEVPVFDEDEQSPAPKPFSQLNKQELIALAAEENVDLTGTDKNDEIRAAIQAKRDSK